MTLKLDPQDPARTKIQYRDPKAAPGTPRILYVADEPDVNERQIVILNGDGSMGFRRLNGHWWPDGKSERDIINAPPDAEELLERMAAILTKYRTFMPTDADKEAKCLIKDYEAWKASR